MHLIEGIPIVGTVYNDTYEYYYFSLKDKEAVYEITLTPKTGNPDLVLSLDRNNMFPDRDRFTYRSEQEFTGDSILINSTMIKDFEVTA